MALAVEYAKATLTLWINWTVTDETPAATTAAHFSRWIVLVSFLVRVACHRNLKTSMYALVPNVIASIRLIRKNLSPSQNYAHAGIRLNHSASKRRARRHSTPWSRLLQWLLAAAPGWRCSHWQPLCHGPLIVGISHWDTITPIHVSFPRDDLFTFQSRFRSTETYPNQLGRNGHCQAYMTDEPHAATEDVRFPSILGRFVNSKIFGRLVLETMERIIVIANNWRNNHASFPSCHLDSYSAIFPTISKSMRSPSQIHPFQNTKFISQENIFLCRTVIYTCYSSIVV